MGHSIYLHNKAVKANNNEREEYNRSVDERSFTMFTVYLIGFLILAVYICIERIVAKLCGFYFHSKHQCPVAGTQTVELVCQETNNK